MHTILMHICTGEPGTCLCLQDTKNEGLGNQWQPGIFFGFYVSTRLFLPLGFPKEAARLGQGQNAPKILLLREKIGSNRG